MVLENSHGNVSKGVANGTACSMLSLHWDNEADRIQAESIIASHRDNSTVCELPIPPDYIVVSVPSVDAASWPVQLNLAPQDDKGNCSSVHIPIGLNRRQSATLKLNSLSLNYKRHAVDLAFATTIHKSQGKSMSHVVLLLDGAKSTISYELVYVSFSRVHVGAMYKCFPLQDKEATQAKLRLLRPKINATRYRLDVRTGSWVKGGHLIRTKKKVQSNRVASTKKTTNNQKKTKKKNP
jgi:hypothetical protein